MIFAMESLTSRQAELLQYVSSIHSARGTAPTLREIAAAFGVCVGSVQNYLRALKRKGYVTANRYARRGIILTRDRKDWRVQSAGRGEFETRFAEALTGEPDLRRIFDMVRTRLPAWLDSDRAELFLHDPQRRELHGGSSLGVAPAAALVATPERVRSDSVVATAWRQRRPVVRTENDPEGAFAAERAARPGLRACAAVPVRGRDRILGVLRLDDLRRSDGFNETKLARAATAAAALAPAIEEGALRAELERRRRILDATSELGRIVNARRDLPTTLRGVHGVLAGLVDAPAAVIAVKDDAGRWWMLLERDEVDGVVVEKTVPRWVLLGNSEGLRAVQAGRYWIRHRTPEEVRTLESQGPVATSHGLATIGHVWKRSRSFLYAPLRDGEEVIGYLSVQSYEFDAYTLRDAEDLIRVGEFIGPAMRNALRDERNRGIVGWERRRLERLDGLEADLLATADLEGEALRTRVAALSRELTELREAKPGPAADA